MAIRSINKDERIDYEIAGVVLSISRITTSERASAARKISRSNRGVADERLIMDALLPKHIHGYRPGNDPDPWVYDENGAKVEPADFNSSICLTWAEDIKSDIYNAMHENTAGVDIRDLSANGEDKAGNSKPGSGQPMNLLD